MSSNLSKFAHADGFSDTFSATLTQQQQQQKGKKWDNKKLPLLKFLPGLITHQHRGDVLHAIVLG